MPSFLEFLRTIFLSLFVFHHAQTQNASKEVSTLLKRQQLRNLKSSIWMQVVFKNCCHHYFNSSDYNGSRVLALFMSADGWISTVFIQGFFMYGFLLFPQLHRTLHSKIWSPSNDYWQQKFKAYSNLLYHLDE